MKAFCLMALVVSASAALAGSGGRGQANLGPDAGDVVVVTVKKVSGHKATNGDPPRLELEIHEVLRGDPKADRSRAVWVGVPHQHDTGGEDEFRKVQKEWEAKPLSGPKAGDRLIVWGATGEKKDPVFRAFSYNYYTFSDENRKKAVALIKDGEERRKQEADRREADRKALEKARADRRAKVSSEEIGKYAAQADVVVIGRVTSEGGHTDLLVSKWLKGRKRKGHDKDWVSVELPKEVRALLDREVDYLLFLTFTEKPVGVIDFYPRIKDGDGIVIADKAALEAVEKALKGK